MNYRHGFHAGGFVDVFKHLVLITLIEFMQKKQTSFCYLDTHAGRGWYDLHGVDAQKTNEWKNGIGKLIQQPILNELQRYFSLVENFQKNKEKHGVFYYPGSPYFAKAMLRPQDEMILCEKNVEEFQKLKKCLGRESKIAIHHMDGFLGLKAFLPPKTIKRGLILIDPPYEKISDYQNISDAVRLGLKRFNQGVFAVWYPIKQKEWISAWLKKMCLAISAPMLQIEWGIYPSDVEDVLHSSGMLIANPPWQFAEKMQNLLPQLSSQLGAHPKHLLRVHELQ